MVHSVSGWTRGVQVKLWDPLRTRAIPERFRGVFTTRRYTNPRLPYLTLPFHLMLFCRTPVRLPYVDPVGGRYSIKEHLFTSSSYRVIRLKSLLGLQVIWDGDHFLQLSVAAVFRRAVCGLCGQFNLSNFGANFSGRRGRHPTTICARLDRPVNAVQLCYWQFSRKKSLFHTFFKQSALLFPKRPPCVFSPPTLPWEA